MTELNDPRLIRTAKEAALDEAPGADWRGVIRSRLHFVAVALVVWVVAIEARLYYLQVNQHQQLVEVAEGQQQKEIPILAKRGDITDRHGRLLAYSVEGEEIYADPLVISQADATETTAHALCAALDECGPGELQVIREKLHKTKSRYQLIKRRASVAEVTSARSLEGVSVSSQSLRYYPNRELAASVLGWVNLDGKGVAGLEHAYESLIGGRAGRKVQLHDRKARALAVDITQPATVGANLQLTIDSTLQYAVERELAAAVKASDAEGGVAVVLEPETGEILAMASAPTFNPNVGRISKEEADTRRNRAVQDTYEYGSVVKVATATAALEERLFGLNDMFDTSRGSIQIGNRPPIRDVHTYAALSFLDVIVKSSNVGIIKVGLKLGPERMDRYFRQFGFGTALSRDFPAERSGNVWPRHKLSDSAIASMSMGYQIGITPLQMAAAINSVANGGELIEPRVVRAISQNGERTDVAKRVIQRTMSRDTADKLRQMMEAVVERGTAKTAQIDGYTIAAKTGTAARVVNGRYSKSLYNASTGGFVPSRNPVATILVTIDSPRIGGYYGGVVAAPVFKRIAEAVLRHRAVPSELNPPSKYLIVRHERDGASGGVAVPSPISTSPVPLASVDRVAAAATQGLMPDLAGAPAREALRTLAGLGLEAQVRGAGVVVGQSVPAGTPVERGAACILTLARVQSTEGSGAHP